MPGPYLQCNRCGTSFHGRYPDHKGIYRPRGYQYGERAKLAEEASANGWTVDPRLDETSHDLCPQCSAKFVVASGFWLWLLNRLGAAALTMPWRTIYVLEQHKYNQSLRRHELVHIEQIEREGPVAFSVKYIWWLLVRGYHENPYEIEAYAKEPINPTEN